MKSYDAKAKTVASIMKIAFQILSLSSPNGGHFFFLKLTFTSMNFVKYVGKRGTLCSKQEKKILCMFGVNKKIIILLSHEIMTSQIMH